MSNPRKLSRPSLQHGLVDRVVEIAGLKLLHYPISVCPELIITMFESTSDGEILTIKQIVGYLKQ